MPQQDRTGGAVQTAGSVGTSDTALSSRVVMPSDPEQRPAYPTIPGPIDRVHFLDEQKRNRRQSWRFSVLAFFGAVITGLPLCLLVTPVAFAVALLAAHIINFFLPLGPVIWTALKAISFSLVIVFAILTRQVDQMPPEVRMLIERLGPFITNADGNLTETAIAVLLAILVMPGASAMFFGWRWIARRFSEVEINSVLGRLQARDPNPNDFEEYQLRNIVEEIAIAANVPPPRLMVVDIPAANSAAVGLTIDRATVIVTRGLIDKLDRDETQAIVAHTIASVANGDLKIIRIIVSLFQAWGLITLALSMPLGPKSRKMLRHIVGVTIRARRGKATPDETDAVAKLLTQGTEMGDDDFDAMMATESTPVSMIRQIPLLLTFGIGSFAGKIWVQLLTTTFLGGIVTKLWRARRLLADATAVQLTRHPDALARAVVRLADMNVEPDGVEEVGYLFAVWTRPDKAVLMRRQKIPVLMPMHPLLSTRLEGLRVLGALVDPTPYRGPGLPYSRAVRMLLVYPAGLVLLTIFFGGVLAMMLISFVVMMALLMAVWGVFQLIFSVLAKK
ncbi:MAG TPA: M48 family metalloprotease [Chthoniobacterales bacterium]|nr:M48 family metalloprotease [Chthoniobacterales bacterium]